MAALTIRNLKKTYSNGVEALKGVDVTVEEGDFFALLGPNGAGKSTLIGIASGLITKTGGEISVYGHDLDTELEKAKSYIGIVPQEFNFGIFEKVEDIIVTQAGYYGIPRAKAKQDAEPLLKALGLWEKRNDKSMMLSGGMKRRLMIARGLIHNPKLLILDEPTAGVDIELRRGMWEYLTKRNKEGVTIILTTHYLEEAEQLCRNVAIINKGNIVEQGSIKQLLLSHERGETVVIDVSQPVSDELVKDLQGYNAKKGDDNTLEITFSRTHNLGDAVEIMRKRNIDILSIRNKVNRLEELFVSLTKEA